jgi:uncharacterized protein YrrD
MRAGKDLIGKPIISITDGRLLGTVKDLYLNDQLYWLTGIHIGTEGLLKRKNFLIPRDNIVVFGIDAVLVKNAEVVTEGKELAESETWPRLSKLKGREVDTPGGTKVGTIGDIIIGEEGHITGFALAKVFVEGPIAEQGQIPREALIDTGNEDGVMTIDLPKVERLQQDLPNTEI